MVKQKSAQSIGEADRLAQMTDVIGRINCLLSTNPVAGEIGDIGRLGRPQTIAAHGR